MHSLIRAILQGVNGNTTCGCTTIILWEKTSSWGSTVSQNQMVQMSCISQRYPQRELICIAANTCRQHSQLEHVGKAGDHGPLGLLARIRLSFRLARPLELGASAIERKRDCRLSWSATEFTWTWVEGGGSIDDTSSDGIDDRSCTIFESP